jgi:hypothetical protein
MVGHGYYLEEFKPVVVGMLGHGVYYSIFGVGLLDLVRICGWKGGAVLIFSE